MFPGHATLTRVILKIFKTAQFDPVTIKEVYRANFEDFGLRFDAPLYYSHRVDLHNELRRLALEPPSEELAGATLHLSSPEADVDCENGVLTLENGRTVQKDVIIGADGIHVRPGIHDPLLRRIPIARWGRGLRLYHSSQQTADRRGVGPARPRRSLRCRGSRSPSRPTPRHDPGL
ncbi:hypothetical protein EDB80DRAFT_703257 [Ilyonectria destructans]|nr:hypothetical protein EDB80DRAFT_703257 [Ilyonectria destructans]